MHLGLPGTFLCLSYIHGDNFLANFMRRMVLFQFFFQRRDCYSRMQGTGLRSESQDTSSSLHLMFLQILINKKSGLLQQNESPELGWEGGLLHECKREMVSTEASWNAIQKLKCEYRVLRPQPLSPARIMTHTVSGFRTPCSSALETPASWFWLCQAIQQWASQGNRWLEVVCEMISLCRAWLSLLGGLETPWFMAARLLHLYGLILEPAHSRHEAHSYTKCFHRQTLLQIKSKQLFKMLIKSLPERENEPILFLTYSLKVNI